MFLTTSYLFLPLFDSILSFNLLHLLSLLQQFSSIFHCLRYHSSKIASTIHVFKLPLQDPGRTVFLHSRDPKTKRGEAGNVILLNSVQTVLNNQPTYESWTRKLLTSVQISKRPTSRLVQYHETSLHLTLKSFPSISLLKEENGFKSANRASHSTTTFRLILFVKRKSSLATPHTRRSRWHILRNTLPSSFLPKPYILHPARNLQSYRLWRTQR